MSSPRFLFGGTEVPSLGGGSTALYDLYRRMLGDGHRVRLVNLLEEQDAAFFQYRFGELLGNPSKLANVDTSWLNDDLEGPQPALTRYIEEQDPDVLIGFGYLAALLFKRAAPKRSVVLVTTSCQQAQDYVTSGGARDAIHLTRALELRNEPPRLLHDGERAAVEQSDLIVAHSPLTLDLMERFFPRELGKIYPEAISFAEWICAGAEAWRHKARPFEERDIDVLFIASHWDRSVKNYSLVEALERRMRGLSIHVIGDAPRAIPGAVHHGFLESREAVFDLIGRARCVPCPSLIDAAPGILFEASVLGSNVVTSRNCGNWELCHPELLVDSFGVEGFAECISRAVARKYDDDRRAFLDGEGYAGFVAVIEAFSRPFTPVPLS